MSSALCTGDHRGTPVCVCVCVHAGVCACRGWAMAWYLFHTAIFPPVRDEVSYICSIAFPASHWRGARARSSRRLGETGRAEVRNRREGKVLEGEERKVGFLRRQSWGEENQRLSCGWAARPPSFSLHLDQQFPRQVGFFLSYWHIFIHTVSSVCDVAGGFGCRWLHKGNGVSVFWGYDRRNLVSWTKPLRSCHYEGTIRHGWWGWWIGNKMRENANNP